MRCPRCGFVQAGRSSCSRCGTSLASANNAPVPRSRRLARLAIDALWLAGIAGGLVLAVKWYRSGGAGSTDSRPATRLADRLSTPSPAAPRHLAPIRISRAASPAPSPTAMPTPTPTPARCPLYAIDAPFTPSRPLLPRDWAGGADGFADAEREQRLTHAPRLVYFRTDWCPYCRRLDEQLMNTAEIDYKLSEDVIKVRINPDDGEGERALADRLGVHGYPTLLLIFDGEAARRITPYESKDVLLTPTAFLQEIEEEVDEWVERRLAEARATIAGGDAGRAVEELDALLAVRPEDPRIYIERGRGRARQGDGPGAVEDWRHAADLGLATRAVDELSGTLAPLAHWGEVAACWTQVIEREPANADARGARAVALIHAGDNTHALEDARTACRLGLPRSCDLVRRLEDATRPAAGS